MLSILLALALPGFQGLIERWRVQQAVDSLRSTMFYARSEAIRRGGDVFVQKLPADTPGCAPAQERADWDCGWLVFVHTDAQREQRQVLQRFMPSSRLTVTRSTASDTIAVDRWGVIGGGDSVGFSIAPASSSNAGQAAKDVCISPGGRIQVVARAASACAA